MKLTKTGFSLNSFQIKLLALIFMTIDHIGAYAHDIPVISSCYTLLRTIGRISAPLFLFAVVQGAIHTRSKWKYFLRLYLAGVCVSFFDMFVYKLAGKALQLPGWGNIFYTFAFVVLYILLAEKLIAAAKAHKWHTVLLTLLCFAATLLPLTFQKLFTLLPEGFLLRAAKACIYKFFPLLPSVQYGIPFVMLGIAMYFAKEKKQQCLTYLIFCILCFVYVYFLRQRLPEWCMAIVGSTYNRAQCYMILALPLMLLYNGQKGRSGKWLFYGYYPLHRYVIAIANFLLC